MFRASILLLAAALTASGVVGPSVCRAQTEQEPLSCSPLEACCARPRACCEVGPTPASRVAMAPNITETRSLPVRSEARGSQATLGLGCSVAALPVSTAECAIRGQDLTDRASSLPLYKIHESFLI